MNLGIDVYPFNLPPGGPFLHFYIVFALLTLTASFLLRRRLADWFDTAGVDAPPAVALSPDVELWKGQLPTPTQQYAVAYLKGGQAAVVDLLVMQAVGYRLLTSVQAKLGPNLYTINPLSSLPFAPLEQFAQLLSSRGMEPLSSSHVRGSAEQVAQSMAPQLEATLGRSRLIRTQLGQRRWRLWMHATAAVLLSVVLIRIALLVSHDRPFGNLIMASFFTWASTAYLARFGVSSTARRDEYLQWLDSATVSLQADVQSGRRFDPLEVGLVLSVAGAPLFAQALSFGFVTPLLSTAFLPATVSTSQDSSGGSSCGSSCSSGGGCGGGCGGGGGCS
jgi:uncharacterized membrane protein YgcG